MTTSTIVESFLMGSSFEKHPVRQLFSDQGLLKCLLRVEGALASAEGAVGLIPKSAATEIAAKARLESLRLDELKEDMDATGHPLVPLVRALAAACEGEAGGYVHWGATTQDIFDTGNVLRYREAIKYVLEYLQTMRCALANLAEREADTLIAGRTHGQHALPVTFGYKVAVWCWEISRQIERWEQAKPRILVGNITGAVGTLAGFGPAGLEVQRLALEELGLSVPEICWHSARDRSAEIAALLTLTAGSLEKIAGEVFRLQSTEYGELEEGFHKGKIGSSTMPHKRNPSTCEAVITAARAVRAEASMVLESMAQEHERHSGLRNVEWLSLPNAFILLVGALTKLNDIVQGLQVDRRRMERNLDLSHGGMASEAVMLHLGRFAGRQRAHDIVYEASMRAFGEGRSLRECLTEVDEFMRHTSAEELDRLFDCRNYVGFAPDLARGPARAFLERARERGA